MPLNARPRRPGGQRAINQLGQVFKLAGGEQGVAEVVAALHVDVGVGLADGKEQPAAEGGGVAGAETPPVTCICETSSDDRQGLGGLDPSLTGPSAAAAVADALAAVFDETSVSELFDGENQS